MPKTQRYDLVRQAAEFDLDTDDELGSIHDQLRNVIESIEQFREDNPEAHLEVDVDLLHHVIGILGLARIPGGDQMHRERFGAERGSQSPDDETDDDEGTLAAN